ncbi:MAG TPA: hypothetical protein VGI74_23305 [Streptosporangiaceae bacterium]
MPLFGNLLRPSAATGPVVEMSVSDGDAINDSITKFRDSSDGDSLKTWGDQVVDMVFDGYAEWASYYGSQPEWVLTNLAQVLESGSQQAALLDHLESIANALPEARDECLMSFKNDIDQWAPNWQYNANAELADAQGPLLEGQERVQAYPNTESWNYSRTPGTFYYKYLERNSKYVYVFNDNADAADVDWRELKYWDDLAETEARKPENKLTAKFSDWDSSWAAWSVLDNSKAEDGRVYGKADEGRWYDYNGAIEARNKELQAQAAQQPQRTDIADSPLMELAQEIHEEVLIPLTEQVMQKLPAEVAGKEGIDVLVRQYVRDDISRRMAALAGQESDSVR